MFKKLKTAKDILSNEGITSLSMILRKRLARKLAGDTLSGLFPVMGHYRHHDGENIPLYACYREYLKPHHFLSHISKKGYEQYIRDNGSCDVIWSGINSALKFHSFISKELQIDIKGKKILEIGCGYGALSYVLAAYGAAKVQGVDISISKPRYNNQYLNLLNCAIDQLPIMSGRRIDELEKIVSISEIDNQSPEINDQFDIILSVSVLEHVNDIRAGLNAMHCLLKKGGVMVHQFNPFFSENGGHEFCILDFPWGHVRLTRQEFISYLETYRTWEKDKAIEVYDHNFNNPKFTLVEIDDFLNDLGFKTIYSSGKRSFYWKPDSAQNHILAQCKRSYPKITWQDLAFDTVIRFVRKE